MPDLRGAGGVRRGIRDHRDVGRAGAGSGSPSRACPSRFAAIRASAEGGAGTAVRRRCARAARSVFSAQNSRRSSKSRLETAFCTTPHIASRKSDIEAHERVELRVLGLPRRRSRIAGVSSWVLSSLFTGGSLVQVERRVARCRALQLMIQGRRRRGRVLGWRGGRCDRAGVPPRLGGARSLSAILLCPGISLRRRGWPAARAVAEYVFDYAKAVEAPRRSWGLRAAAEAGPPRPRSRRLEPTVAVSPSRNAVTR